MQIDLSGRRALVTGSTMGIGYAIAVGLARAGAEVAINGRSEERVRAAIERLAEEVPGAPTIAATADISDTSACERLVEEVGAVDILVNNAAIFDFKPFVAISDAEWRMTFEVNVMAAVRLSRSYVPRMVERGWGRAIFISSESALQIPADLVHYGVTKTALLSLSRGLAESYPGSGVTFNAILPGPTGTEKNFARLEQFASARKLSASEAQREMLAANRASSLLQRLATTEEVANMVVYVASEQASATTGAVLRVDGGIVRAIP
jgi:NAD(P)-dependent dehydrogenase (short-subunit alcohol dehydrogenase family)